MKKALILLCGVVIGGGLTYGVNAACGLPKSLNPFRSQDAAQTVQTYLTDQTEGQKDKALALLSGEAKQIVTSEGSRARPEHLLQTQVNVIAEGSDYAEVEAKATTSQDTLDEDYYLTKETDGWRIFSIQMPDDAWTSLAEFALSPEQQQAITAYTNALAKGDVQTALRALVGPALIRASEMKVQKSLPAQSIMVEEAKGVGKTTNGVLVQVKEKTGQQEINLLYTLAQVNGQWKVYDLRVM